MDLHETLPGLALAAFGMAAWATVLSVGWVAPAPVLGRLGRVVICLSALFMALTAVGAATAVAGMMP